MIDLVLIFSILLASFVISKYISNINIKEEYKTNKYSNVCDGVFICFFVCLIIGFILENDYIKNVSFYIMVVLFMIQCVISFIKLNECNKEFKIILKNNDYNNVKQIKKEMIMGAMSNVFRLLALPLLCLEGFIYFVLNGIFK